MTRIDPDSVKDLKSMEHLTMMHAITVELVLLSVLSLKKMKSFLEKWSGLVQLEQKKRFNLHLNHGYATIAENALQTVQEVPTPEN